MYIWPETEGSRGSQEISACLKCHITLNTNTAKHIITYSDSCTGQNRNIKTVLSMMKIIQSPQIRADIIDMKFLVSGHSYLPNDTDFALIEKKARRTVNIYSPRDWYDILLEFKKKNKYSLTEMKREDFLSIKSLEEAVVNRKKTLNGDSVNWLEMRWIRLEKQEPLKIKFKLALCEEMDFEVIDLQKKQVERPILSLDSILQDVLYPSVRPVTVAKRGI
ncbi:hypothetical protein ANN_14280 [Periplaneta americana]|uniref:Uncharacterized protein n=1 Tax=Periplaneta americana TaxID=6978 RepID=A0ABQ8SWG3_PERAM|nr:hypothetical protein ANN_14280 [Periplaneta americana]